MVCQHNLIVNEVGELRKLEANRVFDLLPALLWEFGTVPLKIHYVVEVDLEVEKEVADLLAQASYLPVAKLGGNW